MTCHNCNSRCKKFGKHRNGLQRYRCLQCSKTFTEDHATPLGDMRTGAFSKKWHNLKAAYGLWFAFYNLCRVHCSLRCTPAMAAGITDHIWSVGELMEATA